MLYCRLSNRNRPFILFGCCRLTATYYNTFIFSTLVFVFLFVLLVCFVSVAIVVACCCFLLLFVFSAFFVMFCSALFVLSEQHFSFFNFSVPKQARRPAFRFQRSHSLRGRTQQVSRARFRAVRFCVVPVLFFVVLFFIVLVRTATNITQLYHITLVLLVLLRAAFNSTTMHSTTVVTPANFRLP